MLLALPGTAHAQDIVVTGTQDFNADISTLITNSITGPGSISKSGTGTLTLTGDNSYAGTTTINAGVLQIGNNGTSGTLGFGEVINNAALTFLRSDTLTVNNLISGTGSVQVGVGTVILANYNTYSGDTTVSGGGTLQIAQTGSAGIGNILLSGGNLRFAGPNTVANGLVLMAGTTNRISVAAGETVALMGSTVLEGGTLRFGSAADTGTINWTLNGGTVSGAMELFVDGGTLRDIDGNVSFIAGVIARTEIASGATLDLNDHNVTIANLQGAGTVLNGGSITTIGGGNFSGNISGNQSVNVTGPLTLGGASTYTGATTVQSGAALTVANGSALGTTVRGTTVLSGGALQVQGGISINEALTLSGTGVGGGGALRNLSGFNVVTGLITLAGATRINSDASFFDLYDINGGSNALTVGGAGVTRVLGSMSGVSSLTKDGAGTLALVNLTNFDGPVFVNAGSLQLWSGYALDDFAPVTMNGGTLSLVDSETIGSVSGFGSIYVCTASGTNVTLTNGRDNTSTTFAGVINGSTLATGNLTKVGTGTFTLTGDNTYNGITTISAGALQIGSGGTTGTLGTGNVVNNASLVFNRSNTIAVANLISGSGGIVQAGSGTLQLTGNNTYVGTTTISGGALQIGNGGTTGRLGVGTVTNNASLVFNRSDMVTEANLITGTGTVTMAGSGTLILTGANTYSGNTILQDGTVQLNSLNTLGTGNIELDGGALRSTVSGTLNKDYIWNSTDSVLSTAAGTVLDVTGYTTVSAGASALRFGSATDTGQIVLSGIGYILSPLAQTIAVEGGTLQAATGSDLLSFFTNELASTRIDAGAALDFNGYAGTIRNLQGAGTLANSVATTVQAGNFSGSITGSGGLIKSDTGSLVLSGTGTFAGGSTVSDGMLQLDNLDALGSGDITLAGGSLRTTVSGTLDNTVNWNSPGSVLSAATGTTLTLTDANLGAGSQVMRFGSVGDTGTIVLSGSAGIDGPLAGRTLAVEGGTLQAASGSAVLSLFTSLLTTTRVDAGATLDFNGNSGALAKIANLQGAGTVTNSADTSILAGDFAGSIAGTGGLVKINPGTLVLTGNNVYGGTTTISDGTLQVGNGGTTGNLGSGAIVNSGSLVIDRAGTLSVVGTISGAGSITKNGSGTLVLTGNNSGGENFTGLVTVSDGALVVNGAFGDAAANSAQVVIGAGAALGGSGTILGSVSSNGSIGAGNSPGTMTIAGDLTLGAGSVLNYELGEAGAVGGLNNDLVVVGGNLTLDGTLNVLPLPTFGNGYYRLFNYGGTLTDGGLDLGSVPTGYTATLLTNIGGQVNILLGGGVQTTQFWDGTDSAGGSTTAGGGGGSGIWSAAGTNWTAPDGFAVNGAWGGQVAAFGGASGGDVSIEGTQSFQELRFITDGYNLSSATAADGLATTGGFSVIDVADGIGATIEAGISGTGGLTKTGSGTLTLAGPNTYAGGTVVSAGRLVGDTASLHGDVESNAALEFAQATNGTYAGSLSGTGSFDKSGAGRLVLTGNSALFTGAANILGGELSVNGLLSGSVVTIGSNSILSGTGTVGGINATSGSTVAPGNSVGTLSVNGNVQFSAGSTYLAEVAATGADLIDATGTAQLAGTLALTNLGGAYQANTTYVLVRADGGREGTFDTTTGLDSFGFQYRPSIIYTATEVQLILAANQLSATFGGFSGTENQMSAIGGLDAAILGGYDPQALSALYSLDAANGLGRALDQLSGGIYPTAVRAALDDGRLVREGAVFRLRDTQDAGLSGAGMWGQVVGSWAHANTDGNGPAYGQDRKGLLIGLDFGNASEEGSWRVGVYAHHIDTDVTATSLGSTADIERTGGGAYAGLDLGRFTARLGVSYSDLKLDARRAIGFTGFSDSTRGKADGDALQGFGEIGYRVAYSEGTFLEPFVAASVESLDLGEFAETGGPASLRVSKQENTFATATLGLRAVTELQLSDENRLRLAASTGAQRNFGDRRIVSTAALNDAPDFGFPVAAVGLEPWVLVMSARAAVDIGDNFTAGIDYSGIIGGSTRDHGVRATLGFRF